MLIFGTVLLLNYCEREHIPLLLTLLLVVVGILFLWRNLFRDLKIKMVEPETKAVVFDNAVSPISSEGGLESELKKADPVPETVASEALKLVYQYLSLGKARLTSLVIISSIAGYMMGSAPVNLATVALCAIGTGLTSASSHAFNQLLEIPFDAQMGRTKQRLLVQNLISTRHAVAFGAAAGILGLTTLYFGVNPLTCLLGTLTWVLYIAAYTPMKRTTIYNTWVGSVVGALPTVMGYTGCMNTVNVDALLLFGISFAWQFPHFNSLSWYLRHDYEKAGYKMMSVCDHGLCRTTTLRYSLALLGICLAIPITGLTYSIFFQASLPINCLFIYLSYDFYKKPENGNARRLFRYSLIYLPLVFSLLLIMKKRCHEVCDDISGANLGVRQIVL